MKKLKKSLIKSYFEDIKILVEDRVEEYEECVLAGKDKEVLMFEDEVMVSSCVYTYDALKKRLEYFKELKKFVKKIKKDFKKLQENTVDPEDYDMLAGENKRMAEELIRLGYTQERIRSVAMGG